MSVSGGFYLNAYKHVFKLTCNGHTLPWHSFLMYKNSYWYIQRPIPRTAILVFWCFKDYSPLTFSSQCAFSETSYFFKGWINYNKCLGSLCKIQKAIHFNFGYFPVTKVVYALACVPVCVINWSNTFNWLYCISANF